MIILIFWISLFLFTNWFYYSLFFSWECFNRKGLKKVKRSEINKSDILWNTSLLFRFVWVARTKFKFLNTPKCLPIVLAIFSTCPLHFASWDNVTHKCLWLEIFDINLPLKEVYNVCQWLATGRWISPDTPVASTNKTDRHDITEILRKVALNTTKQTSNNIIQRDHLIPSTNTVWYEIWQQWQSHK